MYFKNKFIVLFCLLAARLIASPIGNPSDPAVLEDGFWISDRCWSSLRAGAGGDWLFLKRLRPCRTTRSMHISRPEMSWQLAVADIGWNIRERFELHFLGGPVTSAQFQWRQQESALLAQSNRGMFWGAGAKLILLEMKDTTLGADFHGGGIEWMHGALVEDKTPLPHGFSSRLYFWQIAAGLSQNAGFLKPYLGAAVNQFSSIIRSEGMKKLRFHDLVHVGTFEGCSLSLGTKILLNVEARQFFESGLFIAGELRF